MTEADFDDLARLACNDAWQVRSAAARKLMGMGDGAVPLARRMAMSSVSAARAVGIQALLGQGDDAWLKSTFLEKTTPG